MIIHLEKQIKNFIFVKHYIFTNPKNLIFMNKAQLIDAIARETKISKADAKRVFEAIISASTKTLKKGERVALVGFGSFSITKRSARTGRNPQTGQTIQIPARKVVKFKAGAELAKAVNK